MLTCKIASNDISKAWQHEKCCTKWKVQKWNENEEEEEEEIQRRVKNGRENDTKKSLQ